jgi:SAM-dependent methyltransferase
MIPPSPQLIEKRWQCPQCGGPVAGDAVLTCAACKREYEVRDGVPRFFEPPYYWGEITEEEAKAFIAKAQADGWRSAIDGRFGKNAEMLVSLLDWQRTSWVPLLGLSEDAVVLDVGSGYGALTHALSAVAGEVYSIEAVPSRLEFTRIRLLQDGVRNVRLAQATALQLPFAPGMFDAIVVNGVLEWIGEWDQDGDPRELQLRFLRSIKRLLKPTGVLMIGIENRFGRSMFRGERDHSGIGYTSIMPRKMATWWLRHRGRPDFRLRSDKPDREYRTYTYSQSGYEKLLSESGFPAAHYYSATPGYNQPYALVSTRRAIQRRYLAEERGALGGATRRSWTARVKDVLLTSVLSVPDEFVIIARPSETDASGADALRRVASNLAGVQAEVDSAILSTGQFRLKNVIRLRGPRPGSELIVKTSSAGPNSDDAVRRELSNVEWVLKQTQGRDSVFHPPAVLGSFRLGRLHGFVEETAGAKSLARVLVELRRDDRLAYLERNLGTYRNAAQSIAQLPRSDSIPSLLEEASPNVLAVVDGLMSGASPSARARVHRFLSTPRSSRLYVQHGDYSADNIFPSESAPRIIDWSEMMLCGSPAFDMLTLLFSILPFGIDAKDNHPTIEQGFESIVFSPEPSAWARLFEREVTLLLGASGIASSSAWDEIIGFMSRRLLYYVVRSSPSVWQHPALWPPMASVYARLLDRADRAASERTIFAPNRAGSET